MRTILVLSCLVACAVCAPSLASSPADRRPLRELPALNHEEVHDEFGQYALRYVTAENTVVSERGYLVPTANGSYVMAIEGQYEFIGTDGKVYVTKYSGGPDGFHVDADHLPRPVEVPAAK